MTATRTRVFLTGATGNWGRKALAEFAERADRVDVVALVLPTDKDREVIGRFADMSNLEVVYGDLTDPAAVGRCVRGADYVLHVGAVVSPLADEHPELARTVNIGSMRTIIDAVRAQPDPSAVAVVGIGSVAETGDRRIPRHWGRVGDPLRVSTYDEYGQTKIVAERELVESGLPRWAWLRQTGIFHPGMLEIRDPIMTHAVLDEVMEWVTAEDSARLLADICEPGVPEEFWGGIYNIGGGEAWRLTNWQLQQTIAGALGVRDIRRWYERRWFATRNFHGQWYSDSDRLQELVPFRRDTVEQAVARAVATLPRSVRMAGRVPAFVVRNLVMKPLAHRPRGTMAYVEAGDEAGVAAFYGSRADFEAIGDWSTFVPPRPDPTTPTLLDHGYDESKAPNAWTRDDLADAADFRGGALLTEDVPVGAVALPLDWRCAEDHTFTASPRLVLTGGHWCPTCVTRPTEYARQAERNPFLAQIELPTRQASSV